MDSEGREGVGRGREGGEEGRVSEASRTRKQLALCDAAACPSMKIYGKNNNSNSSERYSTLTMPPSLFFYPPLVTPVRAPSTLLFLIE